MKKHFSILFIFFTVFCCRHFSFSQNTNDSLYSVYNNSTLPDTIRLNAISTLTWNYVYSFPDSALFFANKFLALATEKKLKKWQGKALNSIGTAYIKKSEHPKALNYYQQSLKIREQIGDKKGQASTLVNIGVVHMYLNNYKKALEYYFNALDISHKSGNKNEAALAYTNIAIIYGNKKDYRLALDYNLKALKIYEENQDVNSSANTLMGIGKVYFSLSDYSKAEEYYLKAQKIFENNNNLWAQALSMISVGEIYSKQKQSDKAIKEYLNALKISKEIGDLETASGAYYLLYAEYKNTGNSAQALDRYEHYTALKDSIYNAKNQNEIIQREMNFAFEKIVAASKAEQDKKDALAIEEKQKQKIILYAFVAGCLVLIIFSFFIISRYRITQNQKAIIEKQKDVIEAHQKGIVESITYAKRIQDAILPPIHLIEEKIPQSFVLYKPKDIVAGDFYWLEHFGNTTLIAAADCTGHGVPGAMVSVVCSNALNRAVKEFHLTDPGQILDKVCDLVIETFDKSDSAVNDGMDISLLAINKVNKQIKWSGANSPLWFFDNGTFAEIKADKQPIGKSGSRKPFTTKIFDYKEGDSYYLLTDGYADQFGGPKGKKLKDKTLQDILLATLHKKPQQQKEEINIAFENWRGNLEQVDDVCVIGIKLI